MGFGQAISSGLSQFFTFAGRASRSEYWYFYLFFLIAILAGAVLDNVLGVAVRDENGDYAYGPIAVVAVLGLFFPQLAVSVRRLHDTDRSGWWWWIGLVPIVGGIILLVWMCTRGTEGNNKYGPDPLTHVPIAVFD